MAIKHWCWINLVDSTKHTCEYSFWWIVLRIQIAHSPKIKNWTHKTNFSEWKSIHFKMWTDKPISDDVAQWMNVIWTIFVIHNTYFNCRQLFVEQCKYCYVSVVVRLIHVYNRNASPIVKFGASHRVAWMGKKRKSIDEMPNGIPSVNSILGERVKILSKGVTWKWWSNTEINTSIMLFIHARCWC